ncbi:hypothetical protein HCN44_009614 [Aphidius gifuensis]|uniref:Peptidase M12B domain-containing protein n=1 Tax=Aphidius gifuensis TaxID=684658 RepID=A0A834Y436_APHGI|nr:hypothetical protein HCN44_009614 [Aphidius gifuensis]
MNYYLNLTITCLIVFVKFKSSLSRNLDNEKTDRVLFSLNTPIWFSEGTHNSNKVLYKPVSPRSLHDALKFYENPKNMAGINIEKNKLGNWYFTKHIESSRKSNEVHEKLGEIWTELFGKLHNNFTVDKNIKDSRNFKRSLTKSHVEGLSYRVNYDLPVYDGPDPIYPRILLFVNFKENYTTDRDLRFYKLLIYLIAFWNSVDMEFTEFEFPSIKFHIAGIVVGNNEWAAPWLQPDPSFNSKFANNEKGWDNFYDYSNSNDPLPDQWDIPISQSDIGLCSNKNCWKPDISGMSVRGSTCNFLPRIKNAYTAILILDDYSFKGIGTAAHEIGHAFGAYHDGDTKSLCEEHGFVMTSARSKERSSVESWSWCSKYGILLKLRNYSKVCWNFRPSIDKINEVAKILPGHMVTPKDQCIARGYDDVCKKEISQCNALFCKKNAIFGLDKYIDMLENCEYANQPFAGSYCDPDSQCMNKKCLPISH